MPSPELKYPFNVRVYGICFNVHGDLLVADEIVKGREITKLPGGGLEYGEGPADCIKREFFEETGNTILISRHFYTTDFFVRSAFGENQVISIYYEVRLEGPPVFRTTTKRFDFPERKNDLLVFRWLKREEILVEEFTFPIDKKVAELILSER